MYETMFSPVCLGGVELKNRIIFAPASMGLKDEEYKEKIRKIAAGGCAMIIIGDVPVARRTVFGKSLYSRKGFSFYQDLCRIAHEQNCRICAQLHQSDSNIKGMLKYIPGVLTKRISADELRVLLNEQVSALINGMPEWKVREITSSFGPAAALAREAGFDVIQVHGDRMAGSFSSELFNQRRDCYGGKPENRARFAAEAVAAVKKAVPDMPIDYKLAVRRENPDYGKAGVLADELPVFIPILEAAGVTSFHVTLADHSRLTDTIPPAAHPDIGGEGCFLEFCDLVRGLTGLPVTGVGGLTDPDFVEAQLASGRIDCAALCRQLIADPDWPVKLKNGKKETIHRCIRCNRECLGGIQAHRGVHCIYDGKQKDDRKGQKGRNRES